VLGLNIFYISPDRNLPSRRTRTTPHTSNERYSRGEAIPLINQHAKQKFYYVKSHKPRMYGWAAAPPRAPWAFPAAPEATARAPSPIHTTLQLVTGWGESGGSGWVVVGGVQIRCIIGVWRRRLSSSPPRPWRPPTRQGVEPCTPQSRTGRGHRSRVTKGAKSGPRPSFYTPTLPGRHVQRRHSAAVVAAIKGEWGGGQIHIIITVAGCTWTHHETDARRIEKDQHLHGNGL